ncbi:MAG TPA: hypothetical protein VFD01_16125 [Candidatus Dormibacteraeota bacterium]|jgi:hypothetical protein|nr:hypothetical protein [Candidatus Dormibacteraeota bacterium]
MSMSWSQPGPHPPRPTARQKRWHFGAPLLSEVALAARFALVPAVGGELASPAELGLESVRLEVEPLAVPEPVGLHTVGV